MVRRRRPLTLQRSRTRRSSPRSACCSSEAWGDRGAESSCRLLRLLVPSVNEALPPPPPLLRRKRRLRVMPMRTGTTTMLLLVWRLQSVRRARKCLRQLLALLRVLLRWRWRPTTTTTGTRHLPQGRGLLLKLRCDLHLPRRPRCALLRPPLVHPRRAYLPPLMPAPSRLRLGTTMTTLRQLLLLWLNRRRVQTALRKSQLPQLHRYPKEVGPYLSALMWTRTTTTRRSRRSERA